MEMYEVTICIDDLILMKIGGKMNHEVVPQQDGVGKKRNDLARQIGMSPFHLNGSWLVILYQTQIVRLMLLL